MKNVNIYEFNADTEIQYAMIQLYQQAYPNNVDRYSTDRLVDELNQRSGWNYRKFFIAFHESRLVGVGGVKAADWASNTHVMYLSVVDSVYRGQGIGNALEKARIEWVRSQFETGRILVSTKHHKRFHKHGFEEISVIDGRHLMCLEF